MDVVVRDGLELLVVVAVGGMLLSALRRLRRGDIRPEHCQRCGRPRSRAYEHCRWCGAAR